MTALDGIQITRGRSDEISGIEPSVCTVTLDNSDGRFTPRNAAGAYYPNVKRGRPLRVTVTHDGVDYVRFTGYVAQWPVQWPTAVDSVSYVTITAVSRTARLGRGNELRSVIEEEILADGPIAYYTLGEPAEATQAFDSSGNGLTLAQVGSGADVIFGEATGPGTDWPDGGHFSTEQQVPRVVTTHWPRFQTPRSASLSTRPR